MKKNILIMLTLCVFTLTQGCGPQKSGTTQKHFRIAVIANGPGGDFWSLVHGGCGLTAQALGNVELDFRLLTNSTIEAQQDILRDLAASGVDGIAISPIDAEKEKNLLDEIAAKTLLVCVDSDAVGGKRAGYIGTDNVAAGKQAAELIKTSLPEGGKIALFVGLAKAQNAIDRIQGIQSALAGSNIQILDTFVDRGDTNAALKNAQGALAKHPDLAGMVGIYDYNGPTILTAVRGAGKVGQAKIVCFDDKSETMAGIASGDVYGTVVQKPFDIGLRTIIAMDQYLSGNKAVLAGGKIPISTFVVTKDDLDSYKMWRDHRLEQ
jgi:ribose transport system substrate-binding protein